MQISVKCFSSLANEDTCRHDQGKTISLSGDTATVKNLAQQVEIPEQEIHTVFINGKRSELDNRLSDGDRVAFVPAVGGM
jgi:molybdopterin converting factor small subunit